MSDFDQKIAADIESDESYALIKQQLIEAATSEVNVRDATPCARCSCKHIRTIKVPDYNMKLKVIAWLAERGVGRPVAAVEASDEQIVFERVVYLGDDIEGVAV